MRTVRKFFVSAFVIFTFVAYALHERLVSPAASATAMSPQGASTTEQQVVTAPTDSPPSPSTDVPATAAAMPTVPAAPPRSPTAPPTATPVLKGQYKDGTFTGAEVDAYWGFVQVKATIRGGKIADVQFVKYPSDRRTSVRINTIAMPDLTTEAMQVQSANVDIISGATLTSEAFAESLQAALENAKN